MRELRGFKYRVFYSADDCGYVGICYQFPGLSVIADTKEQAEAEIRKVVKVCVKDIAAELGIDGELNEWDRRELGADPEHAKVSEPRTRSR